MSVTFEQLRDYNWKDKDKGIPKLIIGIDPGDTTGVCKFESGALKYSSQLAGEHIEVVRQIADLICEELVDLVICEDYRVYEWKAMQHSNSRVDTLRKIGMIEYLCDSIDIPLVLQSASEGKSFVSDYRLKQWGMFKSGKPHANDAIRHVAHYLALTRDHKSKAIARG